MKKQDKYPSVYTQLHTATSTLNVFNATDFLSHHFPNELNALKQDIQPSSVTTGDLAAVVLISCFPLLDFIEQQASFESLKV